MPSRKYFLVPYILILLLVLPWMIIQEHGDTVLWLNAHRTLFLDFIFKYWTYLGDGLVVGILFLFLLIKKWRAAIVFLLIGLAQLIISQGLKRFVFHDIPRPTRYFDGRDLDLIEGVKTHSSFSFPSGHTITAFATATFFAIMLKTNKIWSVSLLAAAILVAVSRMYLLQHFLRDVVAGSFIGVLISIAIYQLMKGFMQKGEPLKH